MFLPFLSTVSCDKEPVVSQNQATPNVIQARANAAANARKDIDKAFLNYDFYKYKIIPLWDLAVVAKNKKSVEVPYLINGKMIIPGVSKLIKGRQRLLLTLEKSKVSVMVVQYLPNSEFKGNIREIYAENFVQNKFNGKVVFQTLGIDKQYIWDLKNGKVENKKTGKVISKKNLRPNGWEQRCEMISYWIEIGTYENGEYIFLGGYTEEREECTSVWVPDGGDDNGGGDDPTDCNMHPELPWCDNGNGGGGGPSDEEQCYANLEAIANNTSPSDETISETIISNSGGLVEKKYIWKALNGPLWHVESTENAVINTNTNMFESLTHEKAEIVGIAALTTLMSHSITCNPLPSEPSTYKVVTLYFTIGYGLVFENNSCAITRSYNQPKILYPNL